MARKRKQRRQQHGSAWHWAQTDCWYCTEPGTKKRVALFDEDGQWIRGKDSKEAAQMAMARIKLADELRSVGLANDGRVDCWPISSAPVERQAAGDRPMNLIDDRFERQREIVPRDRLTDVRITVIGVGAIGRQLAIQLASIGVCHIQLIDFDHVERSNVTSQGYRHREVGRTKVAACEAAIAEIDPTIQVEPICDRFRRRQTVDPVIFC